MIEEAYNQTRGVVQHISGFQRDLRSKAFSYQFTQEWPVPGVRHQLSYSVPLTRVGDGGRVGLGDIRLNYRYQLVGDGDAVVALSPRLTAVLPTGDHRLDRGAGSAGIETWLPASIMLSDRFVGHGNLGMTVTPRARNSAGDRATTWIWTAGGSLVWLARPSFNALVETLYQRTDDVVGPSTTATGSSITISPGIRWAHNFSSGLQVVPGVALPFGIGSTRGQRSLFLYLSFEHPFTKS